MAPPHKNRLSAVAISEMRQAPVQLASLSHAKV